MRITVLGALAILAVAVIAILIMKAVAHGQNQDPQRNELNSDL